MTDTTLILECSDGAGLLLQLHAPKAPDSTGFRTTLAQARDWIDAADNRSLDDDAASRRMGVRA